MNALHPTDASWRHHVQDQEEDLVRELMQADNVDAVLARMEGDHYRHLSPVMRKLNSFDAPKSKTSQPQPQQQPPSPPPRPVSAQPEATNASHAGQRQHKMPPPPPPPPLETVGQHDYASGRREPATGNNNNVDSRDAYQRQQALPSVAPHARRSSYLPQSAASSAYQGGTATGAAAGEEAGDFSPAARPPKPSSLLPNAYTDYDPLDAYRRRPPPPPQARVDGETESRFNATMESWLKPHREPPLELQRDSPLSSAQLSNPFATTRPPTYAAFDPTSLAQEGGMLPPPTPGSPWSSSGGRYHGGYLEAAERGGTGAAAPPSSTADHRRTPRVSTYTALTPPRRSDSRGRGGETGELENASQSRIARQLQLLRNYRELAELCSNTQDPSVDLFHALPSEELARMQAEQLEQLQRREQSPITVNNNYYFDGSSSRRGSGAGTGGGGGGGGGGARRGHSPGRSIRGRVNSNDTVGARSKAGASPPVMGNSRSISELLTVDSHPGMTSHQPSGASSSQALRPPLLPSPRIMPLQSPQPSSGPDSPVATPPLSQRGAPLAPPSPSRSHRARSHRSRHYDPHYTPTATTEEAGSSYDEDDDVVGDDEGEYAGDFMDNSDDRHEEEDDGTAPRPPPPRIIEREQHRRVPNNSAATGDYATSNAHPPLSPASAAQQEQQHQQQQQQQQQHLQQYMLPQQQQKSTYPGDYMATPSGMNTNDYPPGASRSSIGGGGGGGVAGSENGRRSVSSAINVLSGDQELRANAQLSVSGMVDSRRGSISQPPSSQQQHGQQHQQGHVNAYNGNSSMPVLPHHHAQQQQRRSLSAGSNRQRPHRDGGAFTDPGMGSFSDLPDLRRSGGSGGRGGHSTPEKRYSGASVGSGGGGHTRRGGDSRTNADPTRRHLNSRGNRDDGYGRRAGNRRGGRRRGYGAGEDSEGESDYLDDDLDLNSLGSDDFSFSAGDTPGNPQLQTHNPRSSALRKRRHGEQHRDNANNAHSRTRTARTSTGAAGARGGQRGGGWDDDGAVHTPPHQRAGQRQPGSKGRGNGGNAAAAAGQRPQGERRRQRGDAGNAGGRGGPSSPFFDHDGAEINSASSYSYSYTTSSDISDYVARSYYSPIKAQRGGQRGRGVGGGGGSGGRSPMRGRGTGAGGPNRISSQPPQQMGARPGNAGGYPSGPLSPSQMRGRGGAGVPNSMMRGDAAGAGAGMRGMARGRGSAVRHTGNVVPFGRGGRGGGMSQPSSAERRAPPLTALSEPHGRRTGSQPLDPRSLSQQGTQLPLGAYPVTVGGSGGRNRTPNNRTGAAMQGSPARSPRRGGPPGNTTAAAAAAPGGATPNPNAFVLLPNGMRVPSTSPAAREYRQMLQQQQMQRLAMQRMGMLPPDPAPLVGSGVGMPGTAAGSGFYPVGAAAVSRTPQISPATSPMRGGGKGGGRVMSPSVAASSAPPNNNRSAASTLGGTAAHIHPGLLYGSLLPKARAKTALVVEDDERGRERSVSPHGDASHAPFLDRGSVCPVQPAVPTFPAPSANLFVRPQQDFFPITGAINGATADGVQPLAWKSGGSGCVVGRSGHLPPPPSTKLSSHYVPPNTQQQQQPQQQQQQQRPLVVSILQPQQQQFHVLRQSGVGRRDSTFSLQSNNDAAVAAALAAAAAHASQQRSVPLQEPLEVTRGSVGLSYGGGGGRASEVVDPYTPRGRAAAERSANLQRFGIAPVQG